MIMKRIYKIIFILTLTCFTLHGQSYTRLNNFWDNLYSINPASINDAYLGTLTAATKQQWVKFPGAPQFYQLTGTVYFDDYYTQLGVKVMTEKKGYTTQLDASLSYTYALLLNNEWMMNMGISLGFQNLSYDVSQITFDDPEEYDFYSRLLKRNRMNSDLGLEFNYYGYKFGLASHNLISLFNKDDDLYPNTNILYGVYRQQNSDYISLGLGASVFQYGNIVQGEFNINAYLKKTMASDKMQIGFIYRTWKEVGLIFGVDWDKFKITYSADFNVGSMVRHSYGTHEIMLTYNFNRAYRCINCGWY
ncbi:MAG: putative rane protein [Bacteroidetes bacterium]|nr:putative rane protein [Bacteroidota bacterium]